MKNLKRKLAGATLIALIPSVIFFGCEQDSVDYKKPASNNVSSTGFTKIAPDDSYGNQTNSDDLLTFEDQIEVFNSEIDSTFTVTLIGQVSLNDEKLHSLEISDNLFELTNITPQQIQNEIDYINETQGEDKPSHKDCMKDCRNTYIIDGVKQPGLGGCRFNCWVDTTVRIIDAIVPG